MNDIIKSKPKGSSNNLNEDYTHGHCRMDNTEIKLTICCATEEGWKSSIKSIKTRPGADCGSTDHELLVAELRIKLKKLHK